MLFNSRYLRLKVKAVFAKPPSSSTNYAKKAHPAQYIKYVVQADVNSKLWGNL